MEGSLVKVNLRTESGKDYLEIGVDPYPYPVSYKGEYHLRSGSTQQELKGAALDQFLLAKQGKHWDGVPVPRVTVQDLSKTAIDRFRKLARQNGRLDSVVLREPALQLIDKLRLREGSYLKRAAVLLFHPDPESFFTGAYVKIGFFRTNTELLYHDEIHGDLFTQVEPGRTAARLDHRKTEGQASLATFQPGCRQYFFSGGNDRSLGTRDRTYDGGLSRMTTSAMAHELGLSRRAIEKQVRQLKADGRLRRIGADRGGHWEIMRGAS